MSSLLKDVEGPTADYLIQNQILKSNITAVLFLIDVCLKYRIVIFAAAVMKGLKLMIGEYICEFHFKVGLF